MGVPTLMMLLEPNIVWDHTKGFVPAVGKEVESTYCYGEFFEGWHKKQRLVSSSGGAGWGGRYFAMHASRADRMACSLQLHRGE
jgi:hypothetical protein